MSCPIPRTARSSRTRSVSSRSIARPSATPCLRPIAEGYLVPYRIYKAKTVKTAAEEGFPVRRDELDWSAMDDATRQEFEELFSTSETITVDPSALERRFTIPERNRAMVREFREVLDRGFTGRDGVRRAPQWGKTIVFAVTKRHAETLAQMLDQEFADKKPAAHVRYADFVVSGLGPEDTVDAQTKIKRFKDEEHPQILVSVNMLDTGFDCPEVVNLVMARFTQERDPLSADARPRHAQGRPHQEGRLHHLRLRRRHRLPRRRRRGAVRRARRRAAADRRRLRSRAGSWSWTSTTTSTPPRAIGSRSTSRARPSWPRRTRRWAPSTASASRPGSPIRT